MVEYKVSTLMARFNKLRRIRDAVFNLQPLIGDMNDEELNFALEFINEENSSGIRNLTNDVLKRKMQSYRTNATSGTNASSNTSGNKGKQ